jgi:CspA family cold shock protein
MATGTVTWFSTTKGFGFIRPEGVPKDFFIDIATLKRAGLSNLSDGQKVTFDVTIDRDGCQSAGNIALAD